MDNYRNQEPFAKNGLYDPRFEHENCGIGAVVNMDGTSDRKVVDSALRIVETLEHRAGKDAEGKTGDGVGILLQISHTYFSKVAKEAGISNPDRYVDAATLHSDAEIADAVANYTVFGRVTPDQKRKFVHALKDQGKTVAMTGDGVNDVLALKDADCSVAMASGSDAAVQASQVVLLESNFACMPSVVMEGRRVVNNIQRSASLFLVKNIFSFLLSLFSVVLMITYPMEPSQISLISMFTIGVPGFFLAFQPNKERIQGHFLTNVFLKALPAGLTDVLMVGALVVFGKTFDVNTTDISTAATMLLLIVGFIILFNICKPVNIFRGVVWGGCLTGCILCIIFLPKLFAITGMSTKCIMLFVVFSIATEAVLRYLTLLVKGLQKGYRKIRHREE